MPTIDLLDAFAELVVCIVFKLPHNLQSGSDENVDPQPLQDRHSLNSQCSTNEDDANLADIGHPLPQSHPTRSHLSNHSAHPSGAAQESNVSLDILHATSFTSGSRWTTLSQPSSVNSLNGSITSTGNNLNNNNGPVSRWFSPFRAQTGNPSHNHNHNHSTNSNSNSNSNGHSVAQRPLTATTAETGSFSRIAEEDVLGYRTGCSSGVSSPPVLLCSAGSHPHDGNHHHNAMGCPLEYSEGWEGHRTPQTPLSAQTPGMFSVSTPSTPSRRASHHRATQGHNAGTNSGGAPQQLRGVGDGGEGGVGGREVDPPLTAPPLPTTSGDHHAQDQHEQDRHEQTTQMRQCPRVDGGTPGKSTESLSSDFVMM